VIAQSTDPAGSAPRPACADLAAALVREARAAYWTTTRADGVVAACMVDGPEGRDQLISRLARFTDADRPLGVAVGGWAQGPAGTRQSYQEALEAMHVGERLRREEGRARVHDSQKLAPLALLVNDPERAERFARAALYPLGRLAERSWVLPTLAAYLKCQGRLKEMAAELAVHPSTVKYRLNELRGFLDTHAADGDQAGALLLAVRAAEYFGQDR
jgi:DNA-binding PucR family transcriptional regulator